MPLVDSPRLTPADREHWARLEHYDCALARDPLLDRMADRARRVIEEFAATGPCYAAVSWGKDSLVVAHLVATSPVAERVPLAWARARHFEMPETLQIRDLFLARFPHVTYVEREFEFRDPMRGETGYLEVRDNPERRRQDGLTEALGDLGEGRYISGVRAEESGVRVRAMRAHGTASTRTCRPIGWWRAEDVFAYLARHDLPVHPAYAMTMGGVLDRRLLRVHSLGGDTGTRHGRDAWEDAYYGDVLQAARHARAREESTR